MNLFYIKKKKKIQLDCSVHRFEKESSSMKSWLDRCESVCCPDSDLLCADKVKLRNERLNVQVNYFFYSLIFFCMYEFYFLLA